jgi:Spy/CpxP family protein refolding chaperone
MNRKTIVLLAGVVLGSLVGSPAQAQTPNTPPAPAAVPGAPAARPAMRDRTDVLAQRLGLTDEQKQKVKPIFDAETQALQDLRKDKTVKPEDLRAKYMALREASNVKLKAVLTPEQYEKYTRPFAGRTNAPVRIAPAAPAPAAPAPTAPAK